MEAEGEQRRLAAILVADVVGYSALVAVDEVAALGRLRAARETADALIAEHAGRVFKTTGDGFLAEFPSVVQALRCALAIQTELGRRPDSLKLRMGLHQGDVVARDGDLLGDGVNVAARLEPLAEPGGICISARVHEDAIGKIMLDVLDMGEQTLKNIPRPVRTYRVRLQAPERPALALPDKPSIAVLPFQNMSGDPEQEYFADGMAEEIITALSRIRSFFVIARNSSFTYKGRAVDVRQVGRELGVRYVLEGSVRRGGERVRVSAQLIDTDTGEHVWGERYDRDLVDLFAVQDEITAAVAQSIGPAISIAEQHRAARKPPDNLSAWEAYQRGLWHSAHPTADDLVRARELFNRAIAQDPMFAPPYYLLALLLIRETASYLGRTALETSRLAAPFVQRAIELDPDDADAQAVATLVDAWGGDWDGALARAGQAVAMNPNSFLAHRIRGFCLYNFRRRDEARGELMTCLRLNSRDPQNWLALLQVAITHYLDADYQPALDVAQNAVRLYPSEPQIHTIVAAALGQLGNSAEGREALRRAEALLPQGTSLGVRFRAPFKYTEDQEHILDGLRKAGWNG